MKESEFQKMFMQHLRERFPGCIVTKVESYIQGFPDLLLLYNKRWALLECKRSANAPHQPNQDEHVRHANELSFSRFVYPENEQEVLNELESVFGRST